jgi:hypothetical protein
MPLNKSNPAILHIQDFIKYVELDPTRLGINLTFQLCVSLNILEKDVYLDDVDQDDIPTLIRFFVEMNYTDSY